MWRINFKCHLLKENPGIDFKTEKQCYSNSPLVSQDCSGTFSSSFSSIRDACSGPWPTTHKHRSFVYVTACCCARQHYMLQTWMCIFWNRRGNTHVTASGGLHILTPVCWSPAATLHSQQPLHCLRTCSQLLNPPNTTAAQSGLIIWSHDWSLREQCKSYHADEVRVECLEQQLHQQGLVLLDELVTLRRGEQSHTP